MNTHPKKFVAQTIHMHTYTSHTDYIIVKCVTEINWFRFFLQARKNREYDKIGAEYKVATKGGQQMAQQKRRHTTTDYCLKHKETSRKLRLIIHELLTSDITLLRVIRHN